MYSQRSKDDFKSPHENYQVDQYIDQNTIIQHYLSILCNNKVFDFLGNQRAKQLSFPDNINLENNN